MYAPPLVDVWNLGLRSRSYCPSMVLLSKVCKMKSLIYTLVFAMVLTAGCSVFDGLRAVHRLGKPTVYLDTGDLGRRQLYPRHHESKAQDTRGVVIEVTGSAAWERARVNRLARSLHFAGFPMTQWWRIVILSNEDWDEAVSKHDLNTGSAFTILQQRVTFVSESYLIYHIDENVRFTLGHEAGHLICECSSEDKANEIARALTRDEPVALFVP